MDPRVDSLLVPASLLRVRQFLSRSGLKVWPWAPPERALDALQSLLAARRDDPAFWASLEELLGDLTRDLRRRRDAAGTAVDNEVLEPAQHRALLAELQGALAARPERGFRLLAAALSRQALGALCLVAGVALAGCGGATSKDGAEDDLDPSGGNGSGATTSGGSGSGAATSGGDGSGGSGSGATGGVATGGMGGIIVVLPTGGTGGTSPDTCNLTLDEILGACVADAAYRDQLIGCVSDLNASWRSGIERFMACKDCGEVQSELCRLLDTCTDPELGAEYSLEEFVDHCVVVLYRGVAFE
ncbi:MAG: hypothetical protein JW751_23675 [Polyangiaceae bacterium]|nr:hypothetical protein [Polyangiaceae bacterium]